MLKIEKHGAFGNNTIKKISNTFSEIDFNPPYQRYGNVWPIEKQQLLIDSILNGYDLPKFYMHYITSNSAELNLSGKSYAIVDGKQRLQAIKDFLSNDLKLSNNFIYDKDTSINLGGKTYKDIALDYPDIKYDIDNFELDIVYIITDENEKIEELFYRLNEGKPLNSAEKRNRIVGYINNNIKRIISENDFFTKKFVYSNSRLQYQDLCLKLIITEYHNDLVSFTQKRLDDFVARYRTEDLAITEALDRFESNLSILNEIFEDNDFLLKSRSIIPVYYFFITNKVSDFSYLRSFFIDFNQVLEKNRKSTSPSNALTEFDLNNQQATHTERSLKYRLYILEQYYSRQYGFNKF